jgi:hypothetical protein
MLTHSSYWLNPNRSDYEARVIKDEVASDLIIDMAGIAISQDPLDVILKVRAMIDNLEELLDTVQHDLVN